MANDKLTEQSLDFAVHIINLVKQLKEQRENIMSNQIGRSGTSIGANIREAKYAHGTADFISKMQIALKKASDARFLNQYGKKIIINNSPILWTFRFLSV